MHFASKSLAVFVSALILALVLATPPAAQSSETDRLTHFMVNQKFEVPGKVLEPNTRYVIKLHDLYHNRNVVQVMTDDEKTLITQFLAINDERPEPVDKTTFTFIETQAGYPKPIRSWFYPGRNIGLEFIYPKEQAMEIARHAKEPILTTETAVNLHDLSGVDIVAMEPITGDFGTTATAANLPAETGPISEESTVEEPVEQPEEQSFEIAQNQGEQELKREPEVLMEKPTEPEVAEPSLSEEATEETTAEEAELPATAGELPLVGLIGMLCFGVGLGLRVLSAKS